MKKMFVRIGDLCLDPLEVLAFWPYNRRDVAVSLRGRDGDLVIPGVTVADMTAAMTRALGAHDA